MRNRLTLALLLLINFFNAQQEIYQKVCQFLKDNNPDLIVESKLVIINFDNSASQINKTLYSELEKMANIYEAAKLKGGRKGVICVSIIPNSQREIELNKEGYKKIVKIKESDIEFAKDESLSNIAFSSNGEVVFKNADKKEIYELVHKLITR